MALIKLSNNIKHSNDIVYLLLKPFLINAYCVFLSTRKESLSPRALRLNMKINSTNKKIVRVVAKYQIEQHIIVPIIPLPFINSAVQSSRQH